MAAQIHTLKNNIIRALYDDKNVSNKYLVLLEEKTGLSRTSLASGFAVFLGIYLVFGYGGQLVCNLIGFIYPAYCSMMALETQQKDDDTKWLTYWVVFALFSLVEFFADFIVGWFPFYWLAKCLFLIWCFLPIESNGSVVLYSKYIRPYFLQNRGTVDNLLNDITNQAMNRIAGGAKSD